MALRSHGFLANWSALSLDVTERRPESGADCAAAPRLRARANPEPVVLLPGIMGSLLNSMRGVIRLPWINALYIGLANGTGTESVVGFGRRAKEQVQ